MSSVCDMAHLTGFTDKLVYYKKIFLEKSERLKSYLYFYHASFVPSSVMRIKS